MENRKQPRVEVSPQLVVRSVGSVCITKAENISAGGALIAEAAHLRLGEEVGLIVEVGPSLFHDIIGVVVRHQGTSAAIRFDQELEDNRLQPLLAA